jgi:mono/diheme cytochrome c family protein
MSFRIALFCALLLSVPVWSQQPAMSFPEAQTLLKKHCLACHQSKAPTGGFDITKLSSEQSLIAQPRLWARLGTRIRNGDMPPKSAPAPSDDARDRLLTWLDHTLQTVACADGISPGHAPIRRLNRDEYAATIRDLLNIHVNAAHALPADGAGGEGFDNAAETLFLSPVHAEKYLDAAKQALDYAFTDTKSRAVFLVAEPGKTVTAEEAAQKVFAKFLPRAFRRPVLPTEPDRYMALFRDAQKRGESYERSIRYALQGVLLSPHFLFRYETPNSEAAPKLLGDHALASRLSYFLWGSMPDQTLFDLASAGKLQEPDVLREQISRMLKDQRSREFAERFVEQWLNTRELGRDIKPDAKLFPAYYDADIQGAMRYEPILFFQDVLAENRPITDLIDSRFTFLTNKLEKFYGLPNTKLRQQPVRVELPADSHRGGLLGMSAVLAVSSYPQRTSPVLRGKWILDAMLGTPPPPPPPDVPELEEDHAGGAAPKTMRERLSTHRDKPACSGCHSRIDPLGFALENYDVLGQWRTTEGGKPIDAKGQLPDGTQFEGAAELKKLLLAKKHLFARNLTSKLLGYALGRGLTLEEYCTVDAIVADLDKNNYGAHTLISGIVLSVPFRWQAGTTQNLPVLSDNLKRQEEPQPQ